MSDQQKTPVVRTRAELHAELKSRFGDDPLDWAIQCSMCKTIFTARDFKNALKAEGLNETQQGLELFMSFGRECIGLHDEARGCKWSAYELYAPKVVEYMVTPNGEKVAHFPIAPAPEKRVQP